MVLSRCLLLSSVSKLAPKVYMTVTDLPDYAPVLIGHLVIEHLDLCIDVKRGLIYDPAHGNDWIEEQL